MGSFDTISYENIMTTRRPDIQENFKRLMQSKNIIGGQDYEYLSRITSKDAEPVNSSR